MWVLPLLGYVGVVLGFAFLTLAIGTIHSLLLYKHTSWFASHRIPTRACLDTPKLTIC
jgi:hypothetical protein